MLGIDSLHDTIKSWFVSFWARAKDIFDKNLGWTVSFWTTVTAGAGWLWSMIHWIGNALGPAAHVFDNWAHPTIGTPSDFIYSKLQLANTFVPVEEEFGMIVAFLALLTLLAALKLLRKAIGWMFGL